MMNRKTMWLWWVVAMLCLLPAGEASCLTTAGYLPLKQGNSWQYQTGSGALYSLQVTGTQAVNGTTTYVMRNQGTAEDYSYTSDGQGIRLHRLATTTGTPGSVTFSAPAVVANDSMAVGVTRQGSGSAYLAPYGCQISYATSSTIQGSETITVPKGKYNALKVNFQLTTSGTCNGRSVQGSVFHTYWLASGIGPVRVDWHDGKIYSLVQTNVTPPPPAAGTPATMTVPASDADGAYTVSWAASATAGVTYTVQEATDTAFTLNLRTAYTGAGRSVAVTGRTRGKTYYYRVRASKTGITASAWRAGANGCKVPLPPCGTPATITVPASDADGAYTVSWGASATVGVTYTVQEATDPAFTANLRTAYTGTGRSVAVPGRTRGKTYYYRVRASKTGLSASAWRGGANGCKVPLLPCGTPVTITVPASDDDGAYTVSWGTSATVGVTYALQEATDPAFTIDLRTAYSGSGLSAPISGRTGGKTYYYRVQATKAGMAASGWRTAGNGCAVAAIDYTGTCPLNDTGISWYASDTEINLPIPPAGYEGQDADHGRDRLAADGVLVKDGGGRAGFDFTKLDASGSDLPANAATWSCVRDNHTGLIWEEKTNDGGLRDQDWTYAWYNTDATSNGGAAGYQDPSSNAQGCASLPGGCNTETYVAAVNSQGLCGAADWRLPTAGELMNIVDNSVPYPGPKIDTGYFPHTPAYWFWSSSPSAYSADNAWYVSFIYGRVYHGYVYGFVNYSKYKNNGGYVRLVRGGQ